MTRLIGRISSIKYHNNMGCDVLLVEMVVSSKDQPNFEDLHCGNVNLEQKGLDEEVRGG